MRRRLLLITAFVGLSVTIGLVIFFGARRREAVSEFPVLTSDQRPAGTAAVSPFTQSGRTAVSQNPALGYWLNDSTGRIFYADEIGRVISAKGEKEDVLSGQPVEDVNFILPAPDGRRVAAAFGRTDSVQYSIFDLTEKIWRPLPLGTDLLAWSPDSDSIVALKKTNDGSDLIRLDADGGNETAIVKNIFLEDPTAFWIDEDIVIFVSKPSALYSGEIWQLDLSDLSWINLIAPSQQSKGLIWRWADKAKVGFMFYQNRLTITDAELKPIFNVSELTLPQKCTADAKKIYCFVPQSIDPGLLLPDDYLKRKVYFEDNLYEIDLKTGDGKTVFKSDEQLTFDGVDPQVMNGKVYFKNRYDNRVYAIDL